MEITMESTENILYVDAVFKIDGAEEKCRSVIESWKDDTEHNLKLLTATTGQEARKQMSDNYVDLLIIDTNTPDIGMVIRKLRRSKLPPPVIVSCTDKEHAMAKAERDYYDHLVVGYCSNVMEYKREILERIEEEQKIGV